MFWGSVAETHQSLKIASSFFCYIFVLHFHEGCCWSRFLSLVPMVLLHFSQKPSHDNVHWSQAPVLSLSEGDRVAGFQSLIPIGPPAIWVAVSRINHLVVLVKNPTQIRIKS